MRAPQTGRDRDRSESLRFSDGSSTPRTEDAARCSAERLALIQRSLALIQRSQMSKRMMMMRVMTPPPMYMAYLLDVGDTKLYPEHV